MINRSLMGRMGGEYTESPDELSSAAALNVGPPAANLRSDPAMDNSLAMLGESPLSDEAVMPSEAGATGLALGSLGMMVQGAQGLSTSIPGFVPAEISMWLEQAMQLLPQLLQQMQSGVAATTPGMGMGQTAGLGGSPMQSQPAPSGPPQGMY